jgi:hypothetical protein
MPSRKELALFAMLVLMETLAGFVLFIGLGLTDFSTPGDGIFWLLLLAGLCGMIMGLLTEVVGLKHPFNRVALLAAGVAAALVPSMLTARDGPALLVSLLLLAVAFWRGTVVTSEPPEHEEVQRRFGTGLTVLFFGLIWVIARGIIDQRHMWQLLTLIGVAFTLVSLLALVTSRLEQAHVPGATQAVVLSVGGQIALVFALGVGSLVFFAHDLTAEIFSVTRPIWDVIGPAWFHLLSVIFVGVAWLLEHLPRHTHAVHPVQRPVIPGAPDSNPRRHVPKEVSTEWTVWIGVTFALVLLAGVLALIWHTIPRVTRWTREAGYFEERRSTWSLPEFWQSFLGWLRALFGRSAEVTAEAVSSARRRLLGPSYSEDPVRRLYGQLLHRAELAGMPRADFVTPTEFQLRLARTWPEGAGDFHTLTQAYVLRRYGDESFDDHEVTALRQAWQRARLTMRREARSQPVIELASGQLVNASDVRLDSEWSTRSFGITGLARSVLDFAHIEAARRGTALRTMSLEIIGAIFAVLVLLAFLIVVILLGFNVLK